MIPALAGLRSRALSREVVALEDFRSGLADAQARRQFQLDRLNAVWSQARLHVPYWREAARSLPARFASLEEFAGCVPETTRAIVQDAGSRLADPRRKPDTWRMTGGSTSHPVRLAAWSSEFALARADTWIGRRWYGVEPRHRLFLLWGHAHLLGTGVAGWMRGQRRKLSDSALGYLRYSAYDLRPEAMRAAGDTLLRFAPAWIVGYSVALDAFAAANPDRRQDFHRLGLRVAIATAEAFPAEGSAARLQDLLGCPVAMEYGAVETGILAHTRPGGDYEVFWHRYLVDTLPAERGRRLLVTALFPRCTPLLRYDIGDEVELPVGSSEVAPERFSRVLGRCNEFVLLADGTRVHSEVFSHAVRTCPEIRGFQIVVGGDALRLHLLLDAPLSEQGKAGVLSRLGRVHPTLAGITIARVETLGQTRAGKTRMVVREEV